MAAFIGKLIHMVPLPCFPGFPFWWTTEVPQRRRSQEGEHQLPESERNKKATDLQFECKSLLDAEVHRIQHHTMLNYQIS